MLFGANAEKRVASGADDGSRHYSTEVYLAGSPVSSA